MSYNDSLGVESTLTSLNILLRLKYLVYSLTPIKKKKSLHSALFILGKKNKNKIELKKRYNICWKVYLKKYTCDVWIEDFWTCHFGLVDRLMGV